MTVPGPVPAELCRRTFAHQAAAVDASLAQLGHALAAELNRWIPVRPELLCPVVRCCKFCGEALHHRAALS